jgi:hypothetical protein
MSYFKPKWRFPKLKDLAVLRRAAEGGYFDEVWDPPFLKGEGCREKGERLATALLGRPVGCVYLRDDVLDWDWEVDYGKKATP